MGNTPQKSLSHVPAKRKLTEMQSRFVSLYMIHGEATKAARLAGYSEQSAMVIGYQLLHNTSVQAEIAKRRNKLQQKYDISAERVLREMARIGFSDISRIIQWGEEIVSIEGDEGEYPAIMEACPLCDSREVVRHGNRVHCLGCGWKERILPVSGTEERKAPKIQVKVVLRLKASQALSADDTAAISEIKEDKDGRVGIKLHDKAKALDMLGKHLGLFQDPIADAITGLGDRMAAADARRKEALRAAGESRGDDASDETLTGESLPGETLPAGETEADFEMIGEIPPETGAEFDYDE